MTPPSTDSAMTTDDVDLSGPPHLHHLLTEDRPCADGVVRILSLNRGPQRNALNSALIGDLTRALLEASQLKSVRAIVLTASGSVFCAGGDMKEFVGAPDVRARMIERSRQLGNLIALLSRVSVPIIAAVGGAALGAGAALVTAADLAIAADDMILGFPEIRDSEVPAVVMAGVVHQLSPKRAFEMLSTGRRLTGDEAFKIGLVNRVVARDELVETAVAVASEWGTIDRQILAETKRLFYRSVELSFDAAVQTGIDITAATWTQRR